MLKTIVMSTNRILSYSSRVWRLDFLTNPCGPLAHNCYHLLSSLTNYNLGFVFVVCICLGPRQSITSRSLLKAPCNMEQSCSNYMFSHIWFLTCQLLIALSPNSWFVHHNYLLTMNEVFFLVIYLLKLLHLNLPCFEDNELTPLAKPSLSSPILLRN